MDLDYELSELICILSLLISRLPKKMRIRYCKLWKAIVARDLPGIDKYGRKLGCGDRANLFALILTFRPPSKYAKRLDCDFRFLLSDP